MAKSARIESNDPKRSAVELTVRGEVLNVVTIEPKRIVFNGHGNARMRQAVIIQPEERFPFKILKVETNAGKQFVDHRLETIRHNDRPAYRLVVENRQTEVGRYTETLTLTTDSQLKPKLLVPVYGNILPSPEADPGKGGAAARQDVKQ